MFNLIRGWRERGWTVIDAEIYRSAWFRLGGSVVTHPDVVARLADFAGIPVRYLGWYQQSELVAAVPCWGAHLALSKAVLKKSGQRRLFDLGNAEVILPIAEQACVPVRQRLQYVSALHQSQISGLRLQEDQLALVRPPEELSSRHRYIRRRDFRRIQDSGGEFKPIRDFSPSDRAEIYADLFQQRWGFEAPGKPHLTEVFTRLDEFMAGSVVWMNQRPIAIQVVYRVESPRWISMEFINGGIDPAYPKYSAGEVLMLVNTQEAWDQARQQGKALRYSFGRADREYKEHWTHRTPVYCR